MKYETFKALNCSRKHIIVCVQVFQIICIFSRAIEKLLMLHFISPVIEVEDTICSLGLL